MLDRFTTPWPTEPRAAVGDALGEEHAGQRDPLPGVTARNPAVGDRRRGRPRQVAERGAEARRAMTSSASTTCSVPATVEQVHAEAVGAALTSVDGGVEDVTAGSAAHVLVVSRSGTTGGAANAPGGSAPARGETSVSSRTCWRRAPRRPRRPSSASPTISTCRSTVSRSRLLADVDVVLAPGRGPGSPAPTAAVSAAANTSLGQR